MSALANQIRANRIRLGWSQAELAAKLSVSQSAVGQWERGSSAPRGRYVNALATLFDIPVDELNKEDQVRNLAIKPAAELLPTTATIGETDIDVSEVHGDLNVKKAMGYFKEIQAVRDQQADAFDGQLYELLGQMLGPAKRDGKMTSGTGRVWIIDYLSEILLLEVRHPTSLFPFSSTGIAQALWDMVVVKTILNSDRRFVVVVKNPSFDKDDVRAQAKAAAGRHSVDIAIRDAEMVGIKMILADTPEQAAKQIVSYVHQADET